MVREIGNEIWAANINVSEGGNLFSLLHKPSGWNVFRTPENPQAYYERPQCYGVPPLFPPNRIAGGRFNYNGYNYQLPVNDKDGGNHIHGIVLGRKWNIADISDQSIDMYFEHTSCEGFPHDFVLHLKYSFHGQKLRQDIELINNSSAPMPFGLGFHTSFNITPNALIKITADNKRWDVPPPCHLPTGKLLEDGRAEFDDHGRVSYHSPAQTHVVDGEKFRGAVIYLPEKNIRVVYRISEAFKHWYLWNDGGGNGFFCVEPMTWMSDAPNVCLPDEVTGMQALMPGHSWKEFTEIYLWD